MSEITIRAKSVLKVTDGVNNVDFMADKGVIFSDFISRLPGVSGLSEQNKQLIAKLGLISIAAEEGDMAKVKELIPPSCADVVRELQAEAVSNVKFDIRDAVAVLEQSGDGSFGSDDVEQMQFELAFISDVILVNKANQLRNPGQEKD